MTNDFYVRIKKQHLVLVLGMVGIAATMSVATILAFPVQTALSDHTPDDVDCNSIPCVHTEDIVNRQVTGVDIALNAVNTKNIRDGTVTLADLAPDSVDSSKVARDSLTAEDLAFQSVGSGEVAFNSLRAVDLATDSVGADELAGVSKLIFESTCTNSNEISLDPFDVARAFVCPVPGVALGDSVIVTKQLQSLFLLDCMDFRAAIALDGEVAISLANTCDATVTAFPGDLEAAVIVFHE